ncbi:hypothetical protein POM88_006887 [Heracleum sosnowskyi]|uniref:MULE transposase domain-containing protein n=1 Tax=Heracleum sosnowskyi TaxID=360622 RepID=A0AAD8N555_9APIA|nr:hypothetical protein POM88_006887 [Heracleum sosnowskyi]
MVVMADGGDGGDDGDDGYNGDNGDDMAEDSGDSEGDPAYEYENDSDETEELDSGASDIDAASDEEFVRNKQNYKSVKEGMKEWEYDESDFDSDDLRSIDSSSEDENSKIADLDLGDGTGFTIISDQQKGLENAIKELLPKAEHRFCTRHIYSNFRKKYPSRINAENAQNEGECATNEGAENAPNEGQGAENAEPNVEKTGQNEGECPTNEGQMGEAGQRNGPKRNKLGIRRPKTKGLVIKNSTVIPTQASQTISTVPTDAIGKCKGKETSSSETSHFMYQVLGSVGYDALYCQTDAHPWVWTQPPYNKGPSTSPTVQITQARKPQSPAISAGTPPIPNPSRRSSSRLINVTKSKDQGASKTTLED